MDERNVQAFPPAAKGLRGRSGYSNQQRQRQADGSHSRGGPHKAAHHAASIPLHHLAAVASRVPSKPASNHYPAAIARQHSMDMSEQHSDPVNSGGTDLYDTDSDQVAGAVPRAEEETEGDKREKRRAANREAARRMRARRQGQITKLTEDVARMKEENETLLVKLTHIAHAHRQAMSENQLLHSELGAIKQALGLSYGSGLMDLAGVGLEGGSLRHAARSSANPMYSLGALQQLRELMGHPPSPTGKRRYADFLRHDGEDSHHDEDDAEHWDAAKLDGARPHLKRASSLEVGAT
ncbi:hypothetical protein WJX72_001115 [[Myrmecia] bisecta]|uniref:BZIP domain-containing protein n=1 Tax=[Myrmecia] bisecta TaxID=41462 RepID=A0AAW1PE53_9CHLO